MRRRRVIGLAEMMNSRGSSPGPEELEKKPATAPRTWTATRPECSGRSSRPTSRPGSARPRGVDGGGGPRAAARGDVAARQGGVDGAHLEALLPLVTEYGPGRIAFCTDDRDPEDIVDRGHVNGMVRDAVAAGIEPADALLMARDPAQWHGLPRHGAIAPATSPTSQVPPTSSGSCPTWS